jgi:hypothetical protein
MLALQIGVRNKVTRLHSKLITNTHSQRYMTVGELTRAAAKLACVVNAPAAHDGANACT